MIAHPHCSKFIMSKAEPGTTDCAVMAVEIGGFEVLGIIEVDDSNKNNSIGGR